MRGVFVTDSIAIALQEDWPQLRVVSIEPVIATAIRKFAADGSIRDLY
jgi:phosphoribosylpyrophosphate synthetase